MRLRGEFVLVGHTEQLKPEPGRHTREPKWTLEILCEEVFSEYVRENRLVRGYSLPGPAAVRDTQTPN